MMRTPQTTRSLPLAKCWQLVNFYAGHDCHQVPSSPSSIYEDGSSDNGP